MHPMLNIGIRAAKAAGDFLTRSMARIDKYEIALKGHNDFVSDIDRQAEQIIISTLQATFPDHAILAEESGAAGDSEYVWVIDPLDGTTNYLHSNPQFAVSIALQHKGVTEQGIIYDPLRQEMFTAGRGAGAYLNNHRMRVSKTPDIKLALLGTGFPYRNMHDLDSHLQILKRMLENCAGIRRPGCASLDLAYVACGRLDGFWEFDLKLWDVAAGMLMVTEAGGFTNWIGGDGSDPERQDIAVANAKIHQQLLDLLGSAA